MWVRAIDLYAKIFKSIEPKRVRLLHAESELADLMKALRAETDRVAHIESTITNIQNSYQERVKRKGMENTDLFSSRQTTFIFILLFKVIASSIFPYSFLLIRKFGSKCSANDRSIGTGTDAFLFIRRRESTMEAIFN